jgi:hypothetical protein
MTKRTTLIRHLVSQVQLDPVVRKETRFVVPHLGGLSCLTLRLGLSFDVGERRGRCGSPAKIVSLDLLGHLGLIVQGFGIVTTEAIDTQVTGDVPFVPGMRRLGRFLYSGTAARHVSTERTDKPPVG